MCIVSCADLLVQREGYTRALVMARATVDTAGSMDRAWAETPNARTGRPCVACRRKSPTAVRKPLRGHTGHEREQGVRWTRSTDETGEQR